MKAATGYKFTLVDENEQPKKEYPRDKASNNNHHVVPLGILVVLCTVYLMAAGVQRNYRYYIRPGVAAFDLPQTDETTDDELEASAAASSCQQMDIFDRESEQKPALVNLISKRPQGKANKRTKSGPGNGLVVSKQPRLAKSLDRKKEAAAKKSNTAEPIIYLFALVFIYLLLKAASDINQHYKSNKGDKRLRRCSLQSYAQVHKQDRRSSKVPTEESPRSPIFRRRHILGEVRSLSVDRYKYTNLNEDYHHHRIAVASPLASRQSNHYQQQQYHHHHQQQQQQLPLRPSPGDVRFEPRMNRRSSVPISINYQTVHVSSPYTAPPPELARRGSVISLTDAGASGTVADPKRRVRMINRH